MFYNEWEVNDKAFRYQRHPILGPATQFLQRFMGLVNANSDGWPYWKAPQKAVQKLISLIHDPETATAEKFKAALVPIKSFCTKHKLPMPEVDQFPGVPPAQVRPLTRFVVFGFHSDDPGLNYKIVEAVNADRAVVVAEHACDGTIMEGKFKAERAITAAFIQRLAAEAKNTVLGDTHIDRA